MDTIEAIKTRRSVRYYDPNHTMSENEIHRLMELTMLSPTAFNLQHWRFVLVRDNELRQRLREYSWNQAQVSEASLLVVLCADMKAWNEQPERYYHNMPTEVAAKQTKTMQGFYRTHPQRERDEAFVSGGIAAQTLMLAAKAMGYDSCALAGFDQEKVAAAINLPTHHVMTMFITIGKAIREAYPRSGQLSYEQVVIVDRF